MRTILAICLGCLCAMPAGVIAGDPVALLAEQEKLKEDFLGINLGCTLDELNAVLKATPNLTMKLVTKEEKNGTTQYFFSGNHRLNGVSNTGFSFWKGRLVTVAVFYKSKDAESIYDALKLKLQEKYGEFQDDLKFMGKKCTCSSSGMVFQLEYAQKIGEASTVILYGAHQALITAQEKEQLQKKADGLGKL